MLTVNSIALRALSCATDSIPSYWLNVAAGLVAALTWFVVCISEVAR